tara:strand:- start:353 stop:457 length:105 start_codon:yes stop_codon:yes gene_type:complete
MTCRDGWKRWKGWLEEMIGRDEWKRWLEETVGRD